MDITNFHFSDHTPYPPVETDGKNPQYAAAILSNIGACSSEMTAVSLYFYDSLITRNYRPDIAQCFHRISLVEMRHLDLFGELALKLGADPRLWSCSKSRMYYWCPGCCQYTAHLPDLLTNALNGEIEAIRKYHAQSEWIEDSHIKAILNRIIADEELHVRIFRELLAEISSPEPPACEPPASGPSASKSPAGEPSSNEPSTSKPPDGDPRSQSPT